MSQITIIWNLLIGRPWSSNEIWCKIVGNIKIKKIRSAFQNAKNNTIHTEISSQLPQSLPDTQEENLSLVKNGPYVYIDDHVALESAMTTECGVYSSPDYTIQRQAMSFVVAEDSPYLERISY